MSDDRRNEGNGAVVAIVVVFAIVLLLGVVVVFGAGFLFYADRQVAAVAVTSAPAATAGTPSSPVSPDPSAKPTIDQPPLTVEIKADQKLIVGGEEVPLEKLKERLEADVAAGTKPRVLLMPNQSAGGELNRKVTELLQALEIAFEIKP